MTEIHILLLTAFMTALFFMPYAVTNIIVQGLPAALGNPQPDAKPLPEFARRAKAGHANAVENLVVFAPIILTAVALGATNEATLMAAKIYLGARAVHYIVYTLGIPVIRTLAFFTGWFAMAYIALVALGVL